MPELLPWDCGSKREWVPHVSSTLSSEAEGAQEPGWVYNAAQRARKLAATAWNIFLANVSPYGDSHSKAVSS